MGKKHFSGDGILVSRYCCILNLNKDSGMFSAHACCGNLWNSMRHVCKLHWIHGYKKD